MDIIVKTNPVKEPQGATIAVANIEFEGRVKIRNVTVKEGKNGRFVSMPNYATNKVDEEGRTVYRDVCNPITKEGREQIYGAVLKSLDEKVEIRIKVAEEREKPDISASAAVYEGKNGVVGMARIYLNDNFVINNITIRENHDKRSADSPKYFVAYPSYKTGTVDEHGRNEYKNFCYPAGKEAREKLDAMILEKYAEAKELSQMPQEKEESEKSKEKEESPPKRGIKDKLKESEEKKKVAEKGKGDKSKGTKEPSLS